MEEFEIPIKSVMFRGNDNQQDVAHWFMKDVTNITLKIKNLLKINNPIIMSNEEKRGDGKI